MHIYLDFDGVLCDSVEESFIVSYLAFHKEELEEGIYKDISWRNSYKGNLSKQRSLFKSYRPFIKGAEDFMVLQRAIENGVFLKDEKEYLDYRQENLKSTDRADLYYMRDLIYREDPSWWYSLNSLYGGVEDFLNKIIDKKNFIILSTKESIYIKAILDFYGIDFPKERIVTELKKIAYINSMDKGKRSILVDDQIKYGQEAQETSNIIFYLSSWGYILKDWLKNNPFRVIELDELKDLIKCSETGEIL